jgi:hypothetical protein
VEVDSVDAACECRVSPQAVGIEWEAQAQPKFMGTDVSGLV